MISAKRLLLAALFAGVALRLGLLLSPTAPLATRATDPTGDSPEYVRLAENLARHRIFSLDTVPPFRPDIFRTPVYPLMLAAPLATFGRSLVWPLVLQLVLSLATIWFTRKLALEAKLAPDVASLAGMLVALSPNLAFLSTELITETLFTFLLVVTILLLNRFLVFRGWPQLLAAGACSGLLILTRPIATYFPFLIAGYLLILALRKRQPHLLRAPLILLVTASAVVMPWVVRNGRLTGRYIVSTVSDHNIYLYSGAMVLAADRSIPLTQARDSMMALAQSQYGPLDSTNEASYWTALSGIGWRQLLARPWLALRIHALGSASSLLMPISIRPLLVLAGADPTVGSATNLHVAQQTVGLLARGRIGQALSLAWHERLARMPGLARTILACAVLFHVVLLLFFAVGLFLHRTRRLLWLLGPILYFTILTGPVGEARFRAPVEPLLAVIAAVGLSALSRTSPRRNTPAVPKATRSGNSTTGRETAIPATSPSPVSRAWPLRPPGPKSPSAPPRNAKTPS